MAPTALPGPGHGIEELIIVAERLFLNHLAVNFEFSKEASPAPRRG